MPFSEPDVQEWQGLDYFVQVEHASLPVYFQLVLHTQDDTNMAERDEGLQAFVDLLDASPDWSVTAATKYAKAVQTITPTPAE